MRPRTLQCAEIVSSNPGITRAQVAAIMGCAVRTAGQHLWVAKCCGLIESDGVGRYAGWRIKRVCATSHPGRAVSSVWGLAA